MQRFFTQLLGLSFLSLCLANMGFAETKPELPQDRITHVTLYRGQAMVTREIQVSREAGNFEWVLEDLPEQVVSDSLFAEGEDGIEIRAVRYRERPVTDEPREELRALEAQIMELNYSIGYRTEQNKQFQENLEYLESMKNFVAPTATKELSHGVLNADTLEATIRLIFSQRAELLKETMENNKALHEEQVLYETLQRKHATLTKGASKTIREAVLFLEKKKAGQVSVRLNYLVNGCGWSPQYTFRADEDRQRVAMEYSAVIQQLSGEDWSNVQLILSTASPGLSSNGPALAPFYVTLQEEAIIQTNQSPMVQSRIKQQVKDIRGRQQQANNDIRNSYNRGELFGNTLATNSAAMQLQQLELNGGKAVVQTLQQMNGDSVESPSINYEISGTVSVASRSDQQMVQILQTDLETEFYHIATPVLTSYVYREAKLKNGTSVDLLAGPINVYLEGRYVGRGEISTVARGQMFVVGFGADPQLRTRRELVSKEEDVQGGNRELEFKYRLVVDNYKSETVQLLLMDRLPYSQRDSEIRVTFLDSDVPLSEDASYQRQARPRGLLQWKVDASAESENEESFVLNYSYRIEFDRSFQLASPSGNEPEFQQDFEQLYRENYRR
ncbi:Mucoidy inhibitor MuiA family protein [Planctomycetales bacterium 10988]|nr:Mucoidy inhibitor MuiA family protein [Planctomycetales bacterium 10988]